MTYQTRLGPAAQRAISERLPESVATAALEFIKGAIAESPYRVGKPLTAPYEGLYSARRGAYRVLYRVDEDKSLVTIADIKHRSTAYRT